MEPLNLEVKNIMKIFINKGVILICVFGMLSCTIEMTEYFWNGHYSLHKTAEESRKKREEYYAKETLEQKELREKNSKSCLNWINESYPNTNFDYALSHKKQELYKSCMKERGSPVYSGN